MKRLFRIGFYSALLSITALALMPEPAILPEVVHYSDKLNHVLAFLLLNALFHGAYPLLTHSIRMEVLLVYAFGIEVSQGVIPSRSMELLDFWAGLVGIIAWWAVSYTFFNYRDS